MNPTIFINTRYFKYNDNTDPSSLYVIRIIGYQNTEEIKYEVISGDIKTRGKMKISELQENYTRLNQDGIISIMSVKLKNSDDIMVMFMRQDDLKKGIGDPYVICRQAAVDIFQYIHQNNGVDCFGISISRDSCPGNVEFDNFRACNSITGQINICYYIGDKLNDILSIAKLKNFDAILNSMFIDHAKYKSIDMPFAFDNFKKRDILDGYVKTVDLLLKTNNFEYDIYGAFNIIPMSIDLSNSAGKSLNEDDKYKLSFILRQNICNSIVLKYDKDIDLTKLTHRLYRLISDIHNDIYLVIYDTFGEYHVPVENVESKENIDILNGIYDSKSIKEAYAYIRLNTEKYV